MSKLLIPDGTIIPVNQTLGRLFGLHEAMILQQFYWMLSYEGNGVMLKYVNGISHHVS